MLTVRVWALPLLAAMVRGDAPKWLENSSTMVTDVLDLAISGRPCCWPGCCCVGACRWVSDGIVLLVLCSFLAPAMIVQTISPLAVDVDFTPGEVMGRWRA